MDITTLRIILVYLVTPEDTSAGGQSRNRLAGTVPKQLVYRVAVYKSCLWICLAVIVAFLLANLH